MKDSEKKDKLIDYTVFAFFLLVASAVTLNLFYRQCVGNMQGSGMYHADMKAYILEMQGLDSGYQFPYPVFFKLSALLHLFAGPELSVALATMLLNGAAMVIVKTALNKMTLMLFKDAFAPIPFLARHGWLAGVCVSCVTISLFFVSMLYPPTGIYLPGIKYNYLGVFTANPFHNATYMAARPFAVLAFLWCVKLLDAYESGASWKDYLLFSFFLLLATMTKPSFTIVLVGTAGLIMLYRLFRHKCQNFRATLLLGLAFLPTFLDLLYQFRGVFMPEDGAEGGIGFCFGRIWRLYCDNIPLAIGLAVGFPLLALVINYKELGRNTLYRFSWQIYGMSFAMAFFLYEKGFREPDFNFSWGYMYGIFFVFLGSLVVLVRDTARRRRPLLLGLQWAAYAGHLICGLYYFYGMCQGRMYY